MMKLILLLAFVSACFAALAPLHKAEKDLIPDNYIVVFQKVATSLFEEDLVVIQNLMGIEYTHTYRNTLQGFASVLSQQQLQSLRAHPRVKYIVEDSMAHINQEPCSPTEGGFDWGHSRMCDRNINLDGNYKYPLPGGQGTTSYIIDTGIYTAHTDFGGRATWGYTANSTWQNQDGNGHGTHVASTICGTKYGMARAALAIAVKVLSDAGSGSFAGVISGIEWAGGSCAARRPCTGNLSLGGGRNQAVNDAIDGATALGLIIVCAAGNENNDACTRSPASAPTSITVGSTTVEASGDDQVDVRSFFSNYGTCCHVFAPGSDILGAWIGNPTATRIISGTSMAAPHICGLINLQLARNHNLTPAQAKDLIQGMATPNIIDFNCGNNNICNLTPNLFGFNGCQK